jgi:hypothetical protein
MKSGIQSNAATTSHSKWKNVTLLILAFIASFVTLVVSANVWISVYDEGFVLFDAWRILNGDVPYRDFWTQHAPGQFYLLAALFKIFGPSVIIERLLDAVIKAAILTTCLAVIGSWASERFAVAGWFLCAIWLMYLPFHGFPLFPAILLCLLSAHFIGSFLKSAHRACVFSAGLCSGATALFRHDVGLYICLTNALFLCGHLFVHGRSDLRRAAMSLLPLLAIFAAGVVIVTLPPIVFLLTSVPVNDWWFSLFVVPAQIYPSTRTLPFPDIVPALLALWQSRNADALIELSVYSPLIITTVCAVILVLELGTQNTAETRDHRAIQLSFCALLTLASALLYVKGIVRTSPIHLIQSIIFSIVLLQICASAVWTKTAGYRLAIVACFACILAPSIPALLRTLDTSRNNMVAGTHLFNPTFCTSELDARNCFRVSRDFANARQYIIANTSSQDTIFLGTGRHDKIFANDVAFYFLARRMSATKWHQFHPGIQTRRDIQTEMISEMESRQPSYVVLDTKWDSVLEPNSSAQSSGNTSLDQYIQSNYAHAASFGTYHIYKPRPELRKRHE